MEKYPTKGPLQSREVALSGQGIKKTRNEMFVRILLKKKYTPKGFSFWKNRMNKELKKENTTPPLSKTGRTIVNKCAKPFLKPP
mmetsp:Transcript_20698/g.20986  ORF Transcript_20698/g.20986 Transcript_20698/m.20986 type:complete len:84 (-) Transcript_20698:17-268(-)